MSNSELIKSTTDDFVESFCSSVNSQVKLTGVFFKFLIEFGTEHAPIGLDLEDPRVIEIIKRSIDANNFVVHEDWKAIL